ncbi:MAG: energy transducer TonB [Proteobacteria bacterium]|nr:energy transducer TonB [Pseudomonadota bacterium]
MATSNPAHASRAAAPPGAAPLPLAPASPPLLVLSQDEKFLALLRKVCEPAHAVRATGSEIDFSAALMAHHAGVAVLDAAALASPVVALAARLNAQFPELVLIVAGGAAEQAALAAQITDGSVHRFLHKPLSEQRVRLFVQSAWRRQHEASTGRRGAAPPAAPARRPWWLVAVAALLVAVPLAWLLRSPGNTLHGHSATSAADDAKLEVLLQRADHALATGALVAPPAENAADLYREALGLSARDPRAVSGLEQVIDRLLTDADAQLQAHQLEAAQRLADAARSISPNHPRVAFLAAQIGAQRERLVLSRAQRAAASGDVSSALAVLDDAARGGAHRSTLVDEARQQLAQKQIDARITDYLARAREALATGAVLQPPEQNARFYVESARALAPNSPAVLQVRGEVIARLLAEAHQAVSTGSAEAADGWISAAADAGADAAEVESLRAAAAQLRGSARADTTTRLEGLFGLRMSQGKVLEPAGDSARFYLEQMAQLEPASSSTLSARSAFETRLTDEARAAVHEKDYAGARRWLAAAHANGASPTTVAAIEAELAAATATPARAEPEAAAASGALAGAAATPAGNAAATPAPAPAVPTPKAADSYVSASELTRTRYTQPDFPLLARERGIDGWVDLQFTVHRDGTLGDVTVIAAEPAGVFDQSALDAVRRWRYQPVMRDGQAVEQRARIRVRFAVKS